jgi:hypothetical protein
MKAVTASILSLLMVPASGAFADVTNAGPLAPGKPAGVHNAQFEDGNGMLLVAGAALVGITAALATTGNGVSGVNTSPGAASTSTSTSTSTTGTTP